MDQPRPKILFYNFGARFGGAENVLLKFLEHGSEQAKYHVLLNEPGQFYDRLQASRIPVTIIETKAGRFHDLKRGDTLGLRQFFLIPVLFKLFRAVLAFFKQNTFDLIVSNTYKSHLILGCATWLMRTPTAWRFHDILQHDYKFNRFSKLNLRLLKCWSYRVIEISVVSQAVADSFILNGFDESKIRVVRNGYEVSNSKSDRRKEGQKICVGWIGQFTPWKGIEEFLRLAVQMIDLGEKLGKSIEIRIAGSALFGEQSYEERLKAMVPKTYQDRILFLGHLSNVDEFYSGIDIFFHTATAPDPFPTTVLEAGSHGLLVLASPLGGAQEVIEDGVDGYIRSITNPDDLLSLMTQIINEPDRHLAMGTQLQKRIETTFTLRAYHKQLENELISLTRLIS